MQVYYPLLTFTVGETFPIESPYKDGTEGPLLVTHSEGVNLILYSNQAAFDVRIWESQTLVVGLAQFEDVPFFVLTFPDNDLSLIYSFSIYRMIGDERATWLRSTGRELGVMLVDNETGELVAVRSLDSPLVRRMKSYAADQWKAYPDAEAVEVKIQTLMNPLAEQIKEQINAERVMLRAELTREMVIQTVQATPREEE
jgi:hypothetical protein